MKKIIVLLSMVLLTLSISVTAFANESNAEPLTPTPRAQQFQVVDRKSQSQVSRDSLWFNDYVWYTYKYISVPDGYRPVGKEGRPQIGLTGPNKRTLVTYFTYTFVRK